MGITIAVVLMFVVLLIAAQTELDEVPNRTDVNPSVVTVVAP